MNAFAESVTSLSALFFHFVKRWISARWHVTFCYMLCDCTQENKHLVKSLMEGLHVPEFNEAQWNRFKSGLSHLISLVNLGDKYRTKKFRWFTPNHFTSVQSQIYSTDFYIFLRQLPPKWARICSSAASSPAGFRSPEERMKSHHCFQKRQKMLYPFLGGYSLNFPNTWTHFSLSILVSLPFVVGEQFPQLRELWQWRLV